MSGTGYTPGHEPVVPPRVGGDVPTVDPIWIERFAEVSSCDVADAVGPLYTMDPTIRPLYEPIDRLVGRALTVKAWPGDGLAIYGALSLVQPGDVLVVDWRGFTGACGTGAQVLAYPAERGLRGVVIDGAWRDAQETKEMGLPMFGRGVNPYSPPKKRPGEVNVAVSCGGVVVEAGDLIVADVEGATVIPHAYIEAVWHAVKDARQAPKDRAELLGRAQRRADIFGNALADQGGDVSNWTPRIEPPPAE
jgi:4-hydroxy-4-methyl-2-oxoglutarate aldolase